MGHEVWCRDHDLARALAVARSVGGRCFGVDSRDWDEPDAVFICSPADTHIREARNAIFAGTPALFIEKPLSVSMDGVAELVAQCAGMVTMGACNMRWAYAPWEERWYSRGDILRAGFEVSGPLEDWRTGAREAYEPNGIVLESAIHELDLALTWCGPALGMEAIQPDADSVFITIEHANDVRSIVMADWSQDADMAREAFFALREPRSVTNAPFKTLFARDYAFRAGRTADGSYRDEMAHFLDCVANGTATTNPIANAAETLRWALKARDMTRKVAA